MRHFLERLYYHVTCLFQLSSVLHFNLGNIDIISILGSTQHFKVSKGLSCVICNTEVVLVDSNIFVPQRQSS